MKTFLTNPKGIKIESTLKESCITKDLKVSPTKFQEKVMILFMELGFEYEKVIQAFNLANNNVAYAAAVLMSFVDGELGRCCKEYDWH
jgi:hypothetical protein